MPDSFQVVITGLGLATPLGATVDETWSALIGRRYITDHAEVPVALEGSRAEALAVHVASQALAQSNWPDADRRDTALIVGTSKGAIVDWLPPVLPPSEYRERENNVGSLWNGATYGLAGVAGAVADRLNLGGPRLTLAAACASGLHALIRAAMLIQSGEAWRAVAVAVESSVHPLFLGGFQRLGVLANDGACRPFDSTRTGFLMSEAAAAVTLEAVDRASADGRPFAAIENVVLSADAAHLTGVDPDASALRRMLTTLLDGRPIDLIHAHATGTEANDAVELAAIESALTLDENRRPIIFSHKGALGHSLGASGLVAVVLNCLSHRNDVAPPNVRLQWPLSTTRASLSADSVHRPISRSLVLSAGFGGAMAGVTLVSRPSD